MKKTPKSQEPERIVWKPGTMIYPIPVVMVSCGTTKKDYNIITVAWTGTVSTIPAMCYISIKPERHSYEIIKKTKEFVINLTTKELAFATDWCGVKSGREFDKFREMGLTPIKAQKVKAPLIKEAPINIECKVVDIKELGSHHMFLAEVVAVNANPLYFNEKSGVFNLEKAQPLVYNHGRYFELGKFVGKFGFSVEKKKKGNNEKRKQLPAATSKRV